MSARRGGRWRARWRPRRGGRPTRSARPASTRRPSTRYGEQGHRAGHVCRAPMGYLCCSTKGRLASGLACSIAMSFLAVLADLWTLALPAVGAPASLTPPSLLCPGTTGGGTARGDGAAAACLAGGCAGGAPRLGRQVRLRTGGAGAGAAAHRLARGAHPLCIYSVCCLGGWVSEAALMPSPWALAETAGGKGRSAAPCV